ncbi:Lrp/AsnC family transcriptional regulator [Pelagibius sp. Alg239-R121]|uniref:Lrp/AsnC family transcriptional regulator n=1 Tax=Pelagibius sp. Alg239-R121 TaxID=2993448 RepID=UPI0024A654CC|nr:Lrp/AsnC family transcriptional regulator [Pelagibius sp. Alg239-R121]
MTTMKLDAIDVRILAEIQREGRITKVALAERVGLSPTPAWTRLRRLEQQGFITGYYAHLSIKALGGFARVFMEVTLANHRQSDFERFEKTIKEVPEITGCWAVGGGIDYLLTTATRDIEDYQQLVDRLLEQNIGIDKYFTYVVTKVVKDGLQLPVETLLGTGRRDGL